ncbi:hydrogenase maturation nickel metallochaperone HypA [Amycolatopsis sp. BJA-103]|uniref:hydrogenase maturation nickel metallochaperone HypA/HybF n=1 Tax=unclassified Amycolatopsis TaxID=2618356 RepID=UPI000C7712CA|nr:hydrogenase maturation nickel metallochaperone HypA [Amycolatopsis sp. BJA-103]AUI59222.1 hydrogenase nickel incorporation protein HypA [Amycolatopsis sp. BJA-103]PNE17331.1 hydrogenase nickel incorporation protein HypA [Amycolatopsis sp. BJA-103]
MHELAITQAAVEEITRRLGETPIRKVTLEIGALSGVVVDSVRFCFEVIVDGTPLRDAVLEVIEPPGRARCRDCAREFTVEDPRIPLCPRCGGANLRVLGGQELRIKSVEVRGECAQPAGARTTPESE